MKIWYVVAAVVVVGASASAWLVAPRKTETLYNLDRPVEKTAQMTEFRGALTIPQLDLFQVGKTRVQLCGVSYTKPPSMRTGMIAEIRRELKGYTVTCQPVGTGTVCDGKSPSMNGTVIIAQCRRISDGSDIALTLSEKGLLCDNPQHSGGAYKAC